MRNSMKKSVIAMEALLCLSLLSCGKKPGEETNYGPGITAEPEVTKELAQEKKVTPEATLTVAPTAAVTAAVTSTPAAIPESTPAPTAEPETAEPFAPGVSYLELLPAEDVTVYFREDSKRPQVIVESTTILQKTQYQVYDWDYNLEYGTPFVQPGVYQNQKVLFFFLPTAELAEQLSPIDAKELCGEMHLLSCSDSGWEEFIAADNLAAEIFQQKTTAFYRTKEDGKRVFTLSVAVEGYPVQLFEYPYLQLPEQEDYPVVFEQTAHYTETLLEYRRIGVQTGEDIVWLGKFCTDAVWPAGWCKGMNDSWNGDYAFFPELKYGYYAGSDSIFGILGGETLYSWQLRRLEPDDLIDLDGDGTAEKVIFRKQQNQDSEYQLDAVVDLDGGRTKLAEFSIFHPSADCLFAASLDGRTFQLMLLDMGVGRDSLLNIYQFEGGELHPAGSFPNAKYTAEPTEGENIYSCISGVYQLQNDIVARYYEFTDGVLQEVEQEYYEFLETWRDAPDAPADRNVFTVKEDIELYYEKDGEKTFLMPAGSHAVTLGGDLKEWILFENRDTREQGWLRVVRCDEYGNTFGCILTDGREVNCSELFDGLLCYD